MSAGNRRNLSWLQCSINDKSFTADENYASLTNARADEQETSFLISDADIFAVVIKEDPEYFFSNASFTSEIDISMTVDRESSSDNFMGHPQDFKSQSVERMKYKCQQCPSSFETIFDFSQHEHSHTVDNRHAIRKGEVTCSEEKNLDSHISVSCRKKTFSCITCSQIFSRKEHLNLHVDRKHAVYRPHECRVCAKRFANKNDFRYHVSRHAMGKRFFCPICNGGFTQKNDMVRHIVLHTGTKAFGCNICGKRFVSKSALNVHSNIHLQKRFSCSKCSKSYSSKYLLKYHLRLHNGERPNECSICMRTFSCTSALIIHKQDHAGEGRHLCNYCDKQFSVRYKLLHHVKSAHTKERKFECDVCRKKFFTKQDLSKHILTHSEGQHECVMCKKRFVRSSRLKFHMDTHVKKERLECSVCFKLYIRKGSYLNHVKCHKNNFTCKICNRHYVKKGSFLNHMKCHGNSVKIELL